MAEMIQLTSSLPGGCAYGPRRAVALFQRQALASSRPTPYLGRTGMYGPQAQAGSTPEENAGSILLYALDRLPMRRYYAAKRYASAQITLHIHDKALGTMPSNQRNANPRHRVPIMANERRGEIVVV